MPRPAPTLSPERDELKGVEFAVEHINEGHPLIKEIAPKVSKGLLGKQVKVVSADCGAKPNNAVQAQQTFINDNKIVLMSGSTSIGGRSRAQPLRRAREDPLRHRHFRQ